LAEGKLKQAPEKLDETAKIAATGYTFRYAVKLNPALSKTIRLELLLDISHTLIKLVL